jgi:uncharacterized SAM-binding protein YcdF (DUF218 family)
MLAFLYNVALTLLNPTSVSLLLLIAATLYPRRSVVCRSSVILALAVLLIGGNGWVVGALLQSLEWQYLPPDPVPSADAIVVLSGGTLARIPPRSTLEVSDAGDRVLYAAELFRRGRAHQLMVSGDVATGGLAPRPAAEDMADLLETLGVSKSALVLERKAQNTHDHAAYLCPILLERKITRVLLVTSAIHMRRALGVFRHVCGSIAYTPAPTDFRTTEELPAPWYRDVAKLVPTPRAFLDFSDAAHEYLGIWYYRLRGWS